MNLCYSLFQANPFHISFQIKEASLEFLKSHHIFYIIIIFPLTILIDSNINRDTHKLQFKSFFF
jgi:hypothetical protein